MARKSHGDVLKQDIKYGTMREDSKLAPRERLCFELRKVDGYSTDFETDPIKYIQGAVHPVYDVIAPGCAHHSIVLDTEAGEILDCACPKVSDDRGLTKVCLWFH